MTSIQELDISKICTKLVLMSGYLKHQSEALSQTALYLEKLSHDIEIQAKNVQEILDSQNLLPDLPLELL